MFSLRIKGTTKWAPKSHITYFVESDAYFKKQSTDGKGSFGGYTCSPEWIAESFGKKEGFRKVWETTDSIRRSLATCKREYTRVKVGTIGKTDVYTMGNKGTTIGTFSYYEVVNLITGQVHSLEDVFNKVV